MANANPFEIVPQLFFRGLTARPLIHGVNRKSAKKLRIKVGGFLRQDFPRESDVANLLHANGIHEKSSLGGATTDLPERLFSFSIVRNVLLLANSIFGNIQDPFQKALM